MASTCQSHTERSSSPRYPLRGEVSRAFYRSLASIPPQCPLIFGHPLLCILWLIVSLPCITHGLHCDPHIAEFSDDAFLGSLMRLVRSRTRICRVSSPRGILSSYISLPSREWLFTPQRVIFSVVHLSGNISSQYNLLAPKPRHGQETLQESPRHFILTVFACDKGWSI